MKTLMKSLAISGLSLALASQALALAITPAWVPQWSGPETSQATIDAVIAAILAPSSSVELYKQNVGDATDSGSLAGSYTTTFTNEPDDPADALIDYIGGPFLSSASKFLLVKDGNNDPGWYLFDISVWNGTDDLVLTGFWPGKGAISHVALYGGGSTTRVPDGGTTAILLGAGVLAMALMARRSRK
jgi:hypothetical protein